MAPDIVRVRPEPAEVEADKWDRLRREKAEIERRQPAIVLQPEIIEWLQAGKGPVGSVDLSLLPVIDTGKAIATRCFDNLPDRKQLEDAKIVLMVDDNTLALVRPTIVDFDLKYLLPPKGKYHDQSVMDKVTPSRSGTTCVSCWRTKHEDPQQCQKVCLLCNKRHRRGICLDKVYAEKKWWQEHGIKKPCGMQIRPAISEIACLMLAGMVEYSPGMDPREPLKINRMHPFIQSHYKGEWPEASPVPETMRNTMSEPQASRDEILTLRKKIEEQENSVKSQEELLQKVKKDLKEMKQKLEHSKEMLFEKESSTLFVSE